MIGMIKGIVEAKEENNIILNNNDIGYIIYLPKNEILSLKKGDQVKLYIHSHITEKSFILYGFIEQSKLFLFKKIIKVQGIGPSFAIKIVSGLTIEEFKTAIDNNDVAILTAIPGIGKKNAEKLIFDLKGKLPEIDTNTVSNIEKDAIDALLALGFEKSEIIKTVKKITAKNKNIDTQNIIRYALSVLK